MCSDSSTPIVVTARPPVVRSDSSVGLKMCAGSTRRTSLLVCAFYADRPTHRRIGGTISRVRPAGQPPRPSPCEQDDQRRYQPSRTVTPDRERTGTHATVGQSAVQDYRQQPRLPTRSPRVQPGARSIGPITCMTQHSSRGTPQRRRVREWWRWTDCFQFDIELRNAQTGAQFLRHPSFRRNIDTPPRL